MFLRNRKVMDLLYAYLLVSAFKCIYFIYQLECKIWVHPQSQLKTGEIRKKADIN